MSLRSRKSGVNRNARIDALKRGRGLDSNKDDKEPVSSKALIIIFVLVCVIGGLREYSRVSGRPILSSLPLIHHPAMSRQMPKLDPNFRSLLTAEEDEELEINASDHTRYHVVFSTDCSPYQHWQSYLVYYSAMKVRQPGHVTRIASGCDEEQGKAMQDWFHTHVQGMSTRFHLHLTPYFSGVKNENGETVGDYKFFNKPFGLKHWMEHAEHMSRHQSDDIVVLIDPDMVLLRPITGDFSSDAEFLVGPRRKDKVLGRRVEQGLPFAQTYGLGSHWIGFDLDEIAGPDSPAKEIDKNYANLYYPAGPPYIGTVKDMYDIAVKWVEFVPHVHAQYPHLLAEMYAYCIAAAHLGLRHQLVDSLMISNTGAKGEGWPLLDDIPNKDMCGFAMTIDEQDHALPGVVHLCQRYAVGEDWFFGKRKFPPDYYECGHPLSVEPPADLATQFTFKRPPNAPERKELPAEIINQEAFMVCFLTRLVNQASTFHKEQACPGGTANLEKTFRLVELFGQYNKRKSAKE